MSGLAVSLPSLQTSRPLHLPCSCGSHLYLLTGYNESCYVRGLPLTDCWTTMSCFTCITHLHATFHTSPFPFCFFFHCPKVSFRVYYFNGQNMRISCYFMYQQKPLLLR